MRKRRIMLMVTRVIMMSGRSRRGGEEGKEEKGG